ncbi:hypothetical protein LWI28_007776 [Acer negundo]|uniref:Bulb-type lectin domain-containing protein n=1 Tax=Acer negundo TaxID=4023 RepID=A0AAD5IDW8_ACENE|nr:hypothetical protein LWI28_007776 [Acer negundo]
MSVVSLLLFFFFLSLIFSIAKASVPRSATFKYVIAGEFSPYVVEENATFALGTDGNLVLAEADGSIVWQSNTAKKGVVGFDLLPNGNMVLYDSKGHFVWQSFNYPTDTLLVGQALRVVGGVNRLVSRKSQKENVSGPYSLALEPKDLSMYYNSPGPPVVYFTSSQWGIQQGSIEYVLLKSDPETYEITLEYHVANSSSAPRRLLLGKPKHNSTSSMLRLEIDGNLKIYTYNDKVDGMMGMHGK